MKKLILLLILFGCYEKYREFKTFEKDNIKIIILTQSGNFKIGNNQIKVIIKPNENLLKELFLYMPPTGKNDEKRIYAKLKNFKEGIYEGNLEISEKGIWDLVIILNDGTAISERIPIGDYDKFGF